MPLALAGGRFGGASLLEALPGAGWVLGDAAAAGGAVFGAGAAAGALGESEAW